jgi:hypothetical protein
MIDPSMIRSLTVSTKLSRGCDTDDMSICPLSDQLTVTSDNATHRHWSCALKCRNLGSEQHPGRPFGSQSRRPCRSSDQTPTSNAQRDTQTSDDQLCSLYTADCRRLAVVLFPFTRSIWHSRMRTMSMPKMPSSTVLVEIKST